MTETGHPRLRVDAFRELCRVHHMHTAAQQARGLGVDRSTLSRITSGQRRPGGEFIHRVMRKLRCPYFELFEDETETP